MNTPQPQVSIGLVTWNSERYISTCLRGLRQQDGVAYELIVVDNGSSDQSLARVQQELPDARIVSNPRNNGFCGAHNQAIRLARGEYYLPLNPDIQLQPGYLAAMVAALQSDPACGMAAARLYLGTPEEPSGRLDSTGLFMDRKRRQTLRGHGELDTGQYACQEEVFGVDGSAPLYRREMLEDVMIDGQYFDETFFAHKEDVDLCWRARLLGWKCIYTPQAVAYHERQFRPGQRKNMASEIRLDAVKNRYLLTIKNETPAGWRRDWLPILWYDLKIVAYMLLLERSSLPALARAWRLRPTALVWRREIMRRRKAADDDLLRWFV